MAIHANLSNDALVALKSRKRKETMTSLVISFLSLLLGGILLSLFLIPRTIVVTPTFVTYIEKTEEPEKIEEKPKPTIQKRPARPSSHRSKVITTTALTEVSVPVPDFDVDVPSVEYGNSIDFGNGSGFTPNGSLFDGIPSEMKKRCSPEDRRRRLQEAGGLPQSEKAVMKSLRWIKNTQNKDGSWGDRFKVSMTGFSILAYLGHCEHPNSPEFGESVTRGLTYLINVGMRNDGRLTELNANSTQWVYEHGIATYALAEAYTFCKQLKIDIPNLEESTKKGGDIIIDGQSSSGGWVYRYGTNGAGDNSVGFWQIQALKACKHTGLWHKTKFRKTIRDALAYLEKVQGQNGAIGYRNDPKRSPELTGGGVLAFQFWDKGGSREARDGVEYIRKNAKFEWGDESSNLYYHYYNAQAMINAGGDDWEWYNDMFQKKLLDAQAEDGSWNQRMKHGPVNKHMATCLATFMLEVYYRFLPGTN